MGGWKLEAYKMAVYMIFPVGVFWWFNQPAFFEDWMIKQRKELFPPEDPTVKEEIQKTVQYLEQKKQEQLEAQIKSQKAQ